MLMHLRRLQLRRLRLLRRVRLAILVPLALPAYSALLALEPEPVPAPVLERALGPVLERALGLALESVLVPERRLEPLEYSTGFRYSPSHRWTACLQVLRGLC